MFESVLERGQGPRSRIGLGVVISIVLHAGVLVLVVWFSSRSPQEEKAMMVTLLETRGPSMAAPPPPPPPPPPPAHKKTPTRKPVAKKPDVIARSEQLPQEKQPEMKLAPTAREEEEEEASAEAEEGVEGGVEGGVPGGEIGGVVGGVIGGALGGQVGGTGTGVPSFSTGMTRPKKLSGPQPQYTREALETHVQGLMIVKCVITTEGRVERCRIIKSQPHMEQAVLEALYASRYQPVMLQGRPIQVDYTFNIHLSLPPG
ncbi:energy transducer TonB [Archangium lansingense]|uniref:energy transducer TonB n=1 Tax=Archangium lansingense TaxID=2995310 RepID=UPI003B7FAD25